MIMEKLEAMRFLGICLIIITLALSATIFVNWGKHLDDKGYRLCMVSIIEDTAYEKERIACLETYGVKFSKEVRVND